MSANIKTEKWTEAKLIELLRGRYAAEAYAVLPQVRNSTGFQRNARTADAIVMSLWPSRGRDLMGIEVKVSRGDWLQELRSPAKAEEIQKYCDRWWVLTSSQDIIKNGELPPTWGWMYQQGGKLFVATDAPKLEPETISKGFLAAILRQAQEVIIPDAKLQAEYSRGLKDGKEKQKIDNDFEHRNLERDFKDLREAVAEFQKASGLHITKWSAGDMGEAVRTILAGDYMRRKKELNYLLDQARLFVTHLEETVSKEII